MRLKNYKFGRIFRNAEEFSEFLILECGISTVPWDDVGNYIRLSMTFLAFGEVEEKKICSELYRRLEKIDFVFRRENEEKYSFNNN